MLEEANYFKFQTLYDPLKNVENIINSHLVTDHSKLFRFDAVISHMIFNK